MSEPTTEKRKEREDQAHYYSCAFCQADRPKPFKICESCGKAQPEPAEE